MPISTEKYKIKHTGLWLNSLIIILIWTAVVYTVAIWSLNKQEKQISTMALSDARMCMERDILYRVWNAGHGGVYVPVTPATEPNPYINQNKVERDITTSSGKKLTLVNPAYMSRQVYELGKNEFSILGHITSLNPIRPQNLPDDWESKALHRFEKGENEVYEIANLEGRSYMRYMRPMIVEKSCLTCHEEQGYHEGEIRGGLCVSVPMVPYKSSFQSQEWVINLGFAVLWVAGIGLVLLYTLKLRKQQLKIYELESALNK